MPIFYSTYPLKNNLKAGKPIKFEFILLKKSISYHLSELTVEKSDLVRCFFILFNISITIMILFFKE